MKFVTTTIMTWQWNGNCHQMRRVDLREATHGLSELAFIWMSRIGLENATNSYNHKFVLMSDITSNDCNTTTAFLP